MLFKRARCGICRATLPTGPGFWGVSPAPLIMNCSSCGRRIKTTLAYRYTYYFNFSWKLLFLISIPLVLWHELITGNYGRIFLLPFSVLIMGGLGGFIGSFFLAIPLLVIFDVGRLIIRWFIYQSRKKTSDSDLQ